MAGRGVPQPHHDRLTPFQGHAGAVGIVPDQPERVTLTAVSWAQAIGGASLYFGYADPGRYTIEELADGSVRHAGLDPDLADDSGQDRAQRIEEFLRQVVDPTGLAWQVRYLTGRPDQALTHLARVVDAAAIIVGTRAPGVREGLREFIDGSTAVQLAHHQHRPVLVVPLRAVDWKDTLAWG